MWPQKWNASASPGATSDGDRRARRRRAMHGAADAGEEAAARGARRRAGPRAAQPRTASAAALGGGEHGLELGAVLNVPLASTVPSRVERDRERAAGDVGGRPGVGVARPRRTCAGATRGSRPNAAIAGSSARHIPQPSEVNTASPSRAPSSSRSASPARVRPPTSGPSCGDLQRALRVDREPQHPDLARQREHRRRRARRARAARRRARSRASPRCIGSRGEQRQHRERRRRAPPRAPSDAAADAPARAEARARRARAPRGQRRRPGRPRSTAISAAAPQAAPSTPAPTPTAEHQLDGDQRRPRRRAAAAPRIP